jgi:DNA ligase D-like protein (predicted polymerase)
MAVHVEDHPIDYGGFEGTIPKGQYGAGKVIVWDNGTWEPVGDARAGYRDGKLKFRLHGKKLHGGWTLVRMHGRAGERQEPWLLIKERDDAARPAAEYSVVDAAPASVLSDMTIEMKPTAPPKEAVASDSKRKAPARAAKKTAPRSPPAAPAKTGAAAKVRAPAKAKDGGDATVEGVRISHPDRVVDQTTGITKLEIVNYYLDASRLILPHLVKRPVSLVRAPAGLAGHLVFQRHAGALRIPGLRELDPKIAPDHEPMIEVDSFTALIGAAQANVIEFHTWNATTRDMAHPDRIVFDLDPGEGLAWRQMQEGAELMRSLLEQLGLKSFLKTSGGKGLHVVVPLAPKEDWDTVRELAKRIVEHMAATIPERFVAKSGPKNRVGRIFVDYLRNGFAATTACAWSARARPGLGVSVTCAWDELGTITSGAHWTIRNVHARIEARRCLARLRPDQGTGREGDEGDRRRGRRRVSGGAPFRAAPTLSPAHREAALAGGLAAVEPGSRAFSQPARSEAKTRATATPPRRSSDAARGGRCMENPLGCVGPSTRQCVCPFRAHRPCSSARNDQLIDAADPRGRRSATLLRHNARDERPAPPRRCDDVLESDRRRRAPVPADQARMARGAAALAPHDRRAARRRRKRDCRVAAVVAATGKRRLSPADASACDRIRHRRPSPRPDRSRRSVSRRVGRARRRGRSAFRRSPTAISNLVAMARLAAGARLAGAAARAAERYARHLYRRFDLVLAPSRSMAAHLQAWGVERVACQPLGVDTMVFRPEARDRSWRERHGWSDATRLIVYAGRFAPEKHLDVLAAAVRRLGAPYVLSPRPGASAAASERRRCRSSPRRELVGAGERRRVCPAGDQECSGRPCAQKRGARRRRARRGLAEPRTTPCGRGRGATAISPPIAAPSADHAWFARGAPARRNGDGSTLLPRLHYLHTGDRATRTTEARAPTSGFGR